MLRQIMRLAENALQNKEIGRGDAMSLLLLEDQDIFDLLYWANKIRYHFKGNEVAFCSIISAKQGLCSEDCKFCAQSAHYRTQVESHTLVSDEKIFRAAEAAARADSDSFGIVTSGRSAADSDEWYRILDNIEKVSKLGNLSPCASLGKLTKEQARELKAKNCARYNHNLETSERYFPQICTTHSYQDRIETIRNAKDAGLEVCSGGILGMGETLEDRLDMAFTLKELGVDAIPLNFLNPIPGTPLEDIEPLTPMDILKTIALFRFIFPDKDIKVCGGREVNLRDLQSWMFYAGANGAIIGNYLTTAGRDAQADLQMVRDLGMICRRTRMAEVSYINEPLVSTNKHN